MRGEVSETLRDIAEFEKPYETDDEIPYARHQVGALARLMAVFVEGDVPYPVQSVLDLPMAPVEGKDPLRIVFKARNPVSCFRAAFPAFGVESVLCGRQSFRKGSGCIPEARCSSISFASLTSHGPCLHRRNQGGKDSMRSASMSARRVSWLSLTAKQ